MGASASPQRHNLPSRQGSHLQLWFWNNFAGFGTETASLCVARDGSQWWPGALRGPGEPERTCVHTCGEGQLRNTRVEGYLASWGFLITKADSIPIAVSALRPSKGVGKGPVLCPSWGQVSRKPGLPLNYASLGDGVEVSWARGQALIARARASFPS